MKRFDWNIGKEKASFYFHADHSKWIECKDKRFRPYDSEIVLCAASEPGMSSVDFFNYTGKRFKHIGDGTRFKAQYWLRIPKVPEYV